MKVIGAGFGGTGTMSLKVALEELGLGPCLHPLESMTAGAQEPEPSHWQQIANGEPVDWREAFAGFQATVDWIGARFYGEMTDAWPHARVILSVRDPESWYESYHATHKLICTTKSTASPMLEALDGAIFEDIFGGRFGERDYALKVFQRHKREVTSNIPDNRLLIFDTREGWVPLCEFLGVKVPDTPFPHLNGRSSLSARLGAPKPAEITVAQPQRQTTVSSEQASGAPQPLRGYPRISRLALSDPETSYTQQEVLQILGLADDEFAQRIFGRCGVHQRQLNLTPEMLATTLQGRAHRVEEHLLKYAIDAIEQLEVDPLQIGTVVSATLYSLGGPTLAHRLVEHFEMDPATDKYHIVGVGCASAVPLVRLVSQSLREQPGKKGLVLAAESMTGILMGAREDDPRSKTVGSSIFGDGCAAALIEFDDVSAHPAGPAIIASKVHHIADTLDAVSLQYTAEDSHLHMIRELPDIAGQGIARLVDEFLHTNELTRSDIEHWLIHPGGRRIIESVQEALELSREQVSTSYDVLANHGNVGTPAIFYVMAQTVRQRRPRSPQLGMMVTIGPGVTVGLMLLQW